MEDLSSYLNRNLKHSKNSNMRIFGREFEAFSLGLIDSLLESDGKSKLNRNTGFNFFERKKDEYTVIQFDAIAPDGIKKLEGPTVIDVKTTFNPKDFSELLETLRLMKGEYNSGLLIFGNELSKKDKSYIRDKIQSINISFQIEIWDYLNIINLANQHNEVSSKLINNIGNEVFKLTIEQAKNSSDDWKKERQNKLIQLKNSYHNDEIILMIGAGTSKDAGVPSWNELLKDLNLSIINQNLSSRLTTEEKNEFAEGLLNMQNGAPLVSASYIRNALGENFTDEIKKSLYKNVKPVKEQILLETIAKLSIPRRRRVGIEAVITYNFDDLLENHLKRNGVDFKSIYCERDFEIPTKLSVYHVHGFIPKTQNDYKNLESSILVFSEDGYHQMQSDPYSWSNIVQMKALREKTCVLIGLSGVDPNLRRLFSIHSEKSSTCKHYILLERQFNSSISEKSPKFLEFSKLHHKIQEDTFKEIGLNVIWYEKHSEIPNILEELRNE